MIILSGRRDARSARSEAGGRDPRGIGPPGCSIRPRCVVHLPGHIDGAIAANHKRIPLVIVLLSGSHGSAGRCQVRGNGRNILVDRCPELLNHVVGRRVVRPLIFGSIRLHSLEYVSIPLLHRIEFSHFVPIEKIEHPLLSASQQVICLRDDDRSGGPQVQVGVIQPDLPVGSKPVVDTQGYANRSALPARDCRPEANHAVGEVRSIQ